MGSIRLDSYTLLTLRTGDDPPDLTEEERLRLQDAHLSHLADLHEAGHMVAGGPVVHVDPTWRGLVLFRTDEATALRLMSDDPLVVAGEFRTEVCTWLMPAEVIVAGPGQLPRSVADVAGR